MCGPVPKQTAVHGESDFPVGDRGETILQLSLLPAPRLDRRKCSGGRLWVPHP